MRASDRPAARGPLDAHRWPPGQHCEDVAGGDPVESPGARGGEPAQSPVHPHTAQPGLGRRITYVWTMEGWRYLAVVLDLYARAVVGWAMDTRLTVELTQQAQTMAIHHRAPRRGCCPTRIGGPVCRHAVA